MTVTLYGYGPGFIIVIQSKYLVMVIFVLEEAHRNVEATPRPRALARPRGAAR